MAGRILHEDMEIEGYMIPKGTNILVNLLAIHKDPRYWKNPEKFDFTRFLDKEKKLVKPDAFNPFSFGTLSLQCARAKLSLWLWNKFEQWM